MPKATCCKSRYLTYPAFFGGLCLAAGAITSYRLALMIAEACASGIDSIIGNLGTNFTLSDIDAIVHMGKHNFSVNFEDIHGDLPSSLISALHSLHALPDYCFDAPLAIGLVIACVISITLASTIALSMFLYDQIKRPTQIPPLEEVIVAVHPVNEGETAPLFGPAG